MPIPDLLPYLTEGAERGGVVLDDGTIVELANHAQTPEEGFYPEPAELLPYIDRMVATWHTHPGAPANLSVEDSETFVMWPALTHYIVGADGLRAYRVQNGMVVNAP